VVALASSSGLQAGAGLDRQELIVKLTRPWTIETALTDCELLQCCVIRSYLAADLINGFAAQEPCPSSDFSSTAADNSGVRISNGLMHIDNRSLASLAQRGSIGPGRGVGVGELREALGTNTPLLFLSASISLTDISRLQAVEGLQRLRRTSVAPPRCRQSGRVTPSEGHSPYIASPSTPSCLAQASVEGGPSLEMGVGRSSERREKFRISSRNSASAPVPASRVQLLGASSR
jgi:hypothetical protein